MRVRVPARLAAEYPKQRIHQEKRKHKPDYTPASVNSPYYFNQQLHEGKSTNIRFKFTHKALFCINSSSEKSGALEKFKKIPSLQVYVMVYSAKTSRYIYFE